jgi:nucleoside-diphosphate-sugar epimerase
MLRDSPAASPPETVLVTGTPLPLTGAVAAALRASGHQVREAGSDLTDPAAVAPLLDGVSAIVHFAPLAVATDAQHDAGAGGRSGEALDTAARGTHVLLTAALERGIDRVVLGSTLATLDAYPEDLEVTEQWRPRPQPHPGHLAPYLAELTAREFTRDVQLERPANVVCLRFAPDLEPGAAGDAVGRALALLREGRRPRGHRWGLYHVAPLDPGARYTSALAVQTLGYGAPSGTGTPGAPGGSR